MTTQERIEAIKAITEFLNSAPSLSIEQRDICYEKIVKLIDRLG